MLASSSRLPPRPSIAPEVADRQRQLFARYRFVGTRPVVDVAIAFDLFFAYHERGMWPELFTGGRVVCPRCDGALELAMRGHAWRCSRCRRAGDALDLSTFVLDIGAGRRRKFAELLRDVRSCAPSARTEQSSRASRHALLRVSRFADFLAVHIR
jgi:hypothetical protein